MFEIPLPIYFFAKEHPLKASNKRTHISLLINEFISLIELKMINEMIKLFNQHV